MADGKYVYEVRADHDKLDNDLNGANKKAESAGSKFGKVAAGAGKAIGAAVGGAFLAAGAAVTALGIKGVGLASDLQEVQNVVDTTFGPDADKINTWAKNAAESFGLSELAAKQMNGTMGAMLKSMGLAGNDVRDMSTDLTGLAGDIASFYNLDPTEAFEKLRSGISGETEPLKQLGINMSVANLEAFALSEGITEAYGSMTQAEQATLRYKYLMKTTADAQGDFSKTSDSFANQQRILSLQLDTLAAEMGEILLPVMTEVLGTVRELFVGNDDFKNALKSVFEAVAELAESALPPLIEAFNDFFPILMDAINDILPDLVDLFKELLPPLIELMKEIMPAVVEVFKAFAPLIMELIKELMPPLIDLVKSLAPLIKLLAGIISASLTESLRNIMPIIKDVMEILGGLIDFIVGVFTGDWEKAWNGIVKLFKGIFNLIPSIIEAVVNNFIRPVNLLIKGVNKITGTIGIPEIPSIPLVKLPRLKIGLNYVPEDDFPALLHRGEAVLTAREAVAWRSAGGLSGVERALSAAPAGGGGQTIIIVQPPDMYLEGDKISKSTTTRQYTDAQVRRF